MIRMIRAALGALLVCAAVTGCDDFLTGEGIDRDPNLPSQATRDQLFVAMQAAQFGQQEGPIAQVVCMWMQQCSGVGGRFVENRGRDYAIQSTDFSPDFTAIYTGGGLIDLRAIQATSEEEGDRIYLGIAKAWEGLLISFAADVWGDIPYREAANPEIDAPVHDPQLQVYDDVLVLLDEAIADLQSGAGDGPGLLDLIYGGDADKWIEAANTLKARIHLHTAEVRGAAAYQAAITAATNGISAPANDFRTAHTEATSERNMWFQFSETTFGQDIVAGAFLANLMVGRNDPRLPEYFGRNALGGFGGDDVNSVTPANQVSPLTGSARLTPTFRQPVMTWAENQLILAEAKLQVTGQAAAQPHLDAVRSAIGLGSVPATLQNIMTEKYIALFQNVEAWNDYKRTCLPALDPSGSETQIPGRLFYGQTELNANPNTPSEAQQNQNGGAAVSQPQGPQRNPNDPDNPGSTTC